jgi:hypothetical protein
VKIFSMKSSNFALLFFIIHFSILSSSFAQNKYDIKQFWNESGTIVTQPLNWKTNEWLLLAGITGLTYGTMFLDKEIKYRLDDNQKYANSFPIQFGKFWGEPIPTLTFGLGLYGYGFLADDATSKKIGYEIGQSAFWSGVITQIFKYGFGRERPRHSDDPFSFHPFSFRNDNFLALNSGHTALAFSLSTVLAANTDKTYLKIAAFVPAFLTAFSRVYHNHHWTSDVLLGGVIGYSVGRFVTNLHLDIQVNATTIINPVETNIFVIRIPL